MLEKKRQAELRRNQIKKSALEMTSNGQQLDTKLKTKQSPIATYTILLLDLRLNEELKSRQNRKKNSVLGWLSIRWHFCLEIHQILEPVYGD